MGSLIPLRLPMFAVAILAAILGIATFAACAPATPAATSPPELGLSAPVGAAVDAVGGGVPPAPAKPSLSVTPGTTQVIATWPAVAEATSYRIRWRPQGNDFAAGNLLSVTEAAANFDVSEQGLWVVRVQACNDAGCGRPGTATVPVIINISGHQAVRVWFDQQAGSPNVVAGINLDWDPLPGYYVVKYRLAGNNNWVTSEPLTEPGYTLDSDSFAAFESAGESAGYPIVRVFFNCDKRGNGCALLGRFPNHTMERVNDFAVPVAPYSGGATGASEASGRQERDPLTHLMRPASDFTITNEVGENDVSYRCVSRPAENPWEIAMFGTAADAIKGCGGWKTIDQYILDPDAVFPEDDPCGYRPAQDEVERNEYGDKVKVCNEIVPLGDDY